MRVRTQRIIFGIFAAFCAVPAGQIFFGDDIHERLIFGGIYGVPFSLAIACLFGVRWCRRVLGVLCAVALLFWTLFGWFPPDGTTNYLALWINWGLGELFLGTAVTTCFIKTTGEKSA